MRKLVLLVTVLTLAVSLVACGGGTTTPPAATPPATTPPATTPPATTPPATTPPATTIDAKALYTSKCAACHQANRQGIAGTFPALTPESLANDSLDEIKSDITEGKTGTAMPPFASQLSAAEIDALAKFLKNTPP